MKKTRSITVKNVTGSLLGGILGILAFGYIHPIALPIGCLLGVLIGWWYEEIWHSAVEGWYAGASEFRGLRGYVVSFITTLKSDVANICLELIKAVKYILMAVVNVFFLPCRWFGSHPMNRIFVIRLCAAMATAEISAMWLMPICFKLGDVQRSFPHGSDQQVLIILAQVMLVVIVLMCPVMYVIIPSEDINVFYATWENYDKKGTILFFVSETGKMITIQIAMLLYVSGVFTWFATIGVIFLFSVIAPLSFVIGMIKGIYVVSARSGHLLCLGTTLCVTIVSAWLMHEYFTHLQMLWITALATGAVSALMTEVVRRAVVWCCDQNAFLRHIIHLSIGKQLAPSGRVFIRISTAAGELCLLPIRRFIN